ncbi:hypothetical protein [Pimelobacter simplex]|uniref:hypothetical protein n=1 Tax=Nocardioides simplex TaxID=2045 RepID=UPI003AB1014B
MARLLTFLVLGVLALGRCDDSPAPGPAAPWADLPAGPAPAVPYVDGRHYVTPGRTWRLPGGRRGVSGVLPYADGLLVADATYFEGTNGLALVRHGRRVDGSRCAGGTPVASPDGRYVAWVTLRCPESEDRSVGAVHRAAADGSGEVIRPIGPGVAQVVGFLGREVVHNRGFQDGAWRTGYDGTPVRIPGVDRVLDVSARGGLLVGQRGDRARLVVDSRGSVRWRATTGDLSWFSPDGSSVLAVDGRRLQVLRSADGSARAGLDLPVGADPSSVVWEGERSLLVLVERSGRGAVVRLGLDGAAERATATRPVRPGRASYVLLRTADGG